MADHLIDTHVLIWALTDTAKLSAMAKAAIESDENAILVSAASALYPTTHHKDPFDRLLAAQANDLGIPIISTDPLLDHFTPRRIW